MVVVAFENLPRRYGPGKAASHPARRPPGESRAASRYWLGSGGELAVHAERAVELAGEDKGARVGHSHGDLDSFLWEDVAIELAGDSDAVQRAGLVLDAQAKPLSRLAE